MSMSGQFTCAMKTLCIPFFPDTSNFTATKKITHLCKRF